MDCVDGSRVPGTRKHALSYCSKHVDKEIEWFCKNHEAMFCDTCKRIKHRKCQIISVLDVKSSAIGQSLEDVTNSLLSLNCRIANFKSCREKSAEALMNLKNSSKNAVQLFKSSIIETLDRLQKEILADVDNVVTTETAVIQDHLQTCENLIRDVEAELTTADGAKTAADDVASVVAAYELENTMKMLEPTVADLEQEAYQVHITFQPSRKLTDMINGVDQIGMLDIDRTEKVGEDPSVSASGSTGPVSGRKPVSGMDRIEKVGIAPLVSATGSTGFVSGRKPVSGMDRTEKVGVAPLVSATSSTGFMSGRKPLSGMYRTEKVGVAPLVSASGSTGLVSGRKPVSGMYRTEKVGVAPLVSATGSTGLVSGRKPVSGMEVVSSTALNVPTACITGSAVMPDGRIILADNENDQIILLNPDFTTQSTLTLPSKPGDVAVYGDNAAVVTLPGMKQLKYIHVDTTLRAGHTIPTGADCHGVAVHHGEIYVTVGVGDDGQVQVLDTRGNVTRSIERVYTPYMSMYIAVGRGGTLYISNYWNEHITCYSNTGDLVYDVKHEGMYGPCGMVVDEDDNLLVCCQGSNVIHVLGKDGEHRSVILSSADGLVRPYSVSYRRSDQTLIVTMMNTPSCRAYKLK